MGNCLRHSSSTTCPSDNWDHTIESGAPCSNGGEKEMGEKLLGKKNPTIERVAPYRDGEKKEVGEKLLGEKNGVPSTEVKIKLTKKQVVELLGRVDIHGLSIEEIIDHLMIIRGESQLRHRSWRPALRSIPEVN